MVDTAQSSPTNSRQVLLDAQNFSLFLGGPLFQLLRRAHLADDALLMIRQRVLFIALLAWLPLALLSALEGNLWESAVAVPFLMDLEVHIRFLVVVPLLIVAELVVHRRMRPIGMAFIERELIPDSELSRFDACLAAALRLRNSVVAEALLIAIVYGLGIMVIWRHYTALDASTWYAAASTHGAGLSIAGNWYGYVSLPIFQFLLIRWYFRLFIWVRFLWQVSRINMHLIPTHPDRVGGLGFLAQIAHALTVLAVAHGAMVSAQFANRIFFLGAKLVDFKVEIGTMVGFLVIVTFGPLLFFSPQLAEKKRNGLREYGGLAQRYVRGFDAKWLRGEASADEPFVGSADIQSLADMGNSFEIVQSMRIAPITRDAIVRLAAAVLIPIAPLALTMMPLEELLGQLLKILF